MAKAKRAAKAGAKRMAKGAARGKAKAAKKPAAKAAKKPAARRAAARKPAPRRAAKAAKPRGVQAIPAGCERILVHLVVKGAAQALDFYRNAFGAEEVMRLPAPDGRLMHAEFRIGDSLVYVCDDFPEYCEGKSRAAASLGGTPVTIHRYVADTDAAIAKAAAAGATVVMPAMDMFWGDRYGIVQDPFGHMWSFATHQKDLTPDEILAAQAAAFAQGPPSS